MSDNTSNPGQDLESTDYPTSLYIGLHVIGIPLGLAIIVGNVLLLAAFKSCNKKQQKAFKAKTTVLLASLSMGELFAGLVLILNVGLYPVFDVVGSYSTAGCYFWNVIKIVPLLGGFLHLTALGIERYVIVNQTPTHPRMKRLIIYICLLWLYAFICGFLAFAFLGHLRDDAYDICDILVISPLYVTVLIFTQIMICAITCTALILVVRNIVKLHQRKVQVSNTITYNNMLDDTKSAQLIYLVTIVSYVLWLPFLVCEILMAAGMESRDVMMASRWSFLLGHVAYTKCYWYLLGSKGLRTDFKRTFGKADKRPLRLGTGRIREG